MPLSPALQQSIERLQSELKKTRGDFRKKLSAALFESLPFPGQTLQKSTGDVKEEFEIIATSIGIAHTKGDNEQGPFKEEFIAKFFEYFESTESTEIKGSKEVKIFTIIEKADHPEFKEEAVEAVDEDLRRFNAQQQGWLLEKCLSSAGVKNTNIIKLIDLQNSQLTIGLTRAALTWKEKTDDGSVERRMSDDEALELID